jgi:hypothetical protein
MSRAARQMLLHRFQNLLFMWKLVLYRQTPLTAMEGLTP